MRVEGSRGVPSEQGSPAPGRLESLLAEVPAGDCNLDEGPHAGEEAPEAS